MIRDWIEKNIRWFVFGGIALAGVILLIIFGPGACSNRQAVEQARQTTRSGEAISNAAAEAIADIGNTTANESVIDEAVANTQEGIANAQDPAAVRAAVVQRLCADPRHRLDPACRMR